MKIGANLAGMMQNYQHSLGSPTISSVLGTRDAVGSIFPGHPSFLFARAKGIDIGGAGWEHAIAVNQVGQRFYNESAIGDTSSDAKYPPGTDGTRKPFVPLDWRNASTAQVKAQYKRSAAADAALAMNEGSRAPDYASGPVWAIFDSAAVNARRLADPLSLHRRSARRLLPQGRYAGRAGAEGHGASASEDAAEISRGDGARGTTRSPTRARTKTSRSRSCIAIDTPPFYAAIGQHPRARFLWRSADQRQGAGPRYATARSSPASMPAAKRAAAARSTASAAPRCTATSPARTRRRSGFPEASVDAISRSHPRRVGTRPQRSPAAAELIAGGRVALLTACGEG